MRMLDSFLFAVLCIATLASALPATKEAPNHAAEHHKLNAVMTPPAGIANQPIIPKVVYHNQALNGFPRVKRSIIKLDHRKNHENVYSIGSGERGIRYI